MPVVRRLVLLGTLLLVLVIAAPAHAQESSLPKVSGKPGSWFVWKDDGMGGQERVALSNGQLAYTGFGAGYVALLGGGMVVTGAALRRRLSLADGRA